MQTVETHAGEWMSRELARCKSSLLVSSPYLNAGFVKLCRDLPAGGERFLLTRTKVMDFARSPPTWVHWSRWRVADFQFLVTRPFMQRFTSWTGGQLLSHQRTRPTQGFGETWKPESLMDDPASVKTLANCVTDAFGKRKECTEWTADKLSALSPIVETIRKRLPTIDVVVPDTTTTTESDSIDTNTAVEISTQLTGWKRLVWECVLSLKR